MTIRKLVPPPESETLYQNELVICMWNVNGWTQNNCNLRERILMSQNPDIICLTETHLIGENKAEIQGFSGYFRNRPLGDKRLSKGSGGVGILFRNGLRNTFEIENCYVHLDNVLGIKLRNKETDEQIAVYCVYLPPDNSKYSSENEQILNGLVIEIYSQVDSDNVYICGDFNARIGNKQDCAEYDDVPKRIPVDMTSNVQGEKLLTFINDIRGCVING